MIYAVREYDKSRSGFNAASKARNDADRIFETAGASELTVPVPDASLREKSGKATGLLLHVSVAKDWRRALASARAGDTVLFQFPVRAHTILLGRVLKSLRRRGIHAVALIHDLETLRFALDQQVMKKTSLRLKLEEVSALKLFDRVIAHNGSMKRFLAEKMGIAESRMVELGIFDYLIPGFEPVFASRDRFSVNIAGNMDPEKSGYLYHLPAGVCFELYGANWQGAENDWVRYHGKFPPDELPGKLCGGFGLVWDGPEAETCSGVYGSYLRYNNPHKTSLYLASGIPVIIWEEAALAPFIVQEGCGITAGSLAELPGKLQGITDESYGEMLRNAERIGKQLREGHYTLRALAACGVSA